MSSSSDINRLVHKLDDISRRLSRLDDIAKSLKRVSDALAALNENFVLLGRKMREMNVVPPVVEEEVPTAWCLNDVPAYLKYGRDDQGRMLPVEWRDEIGLEHLTDELKPHAGSERVRMDRKSFLTYDEAIRIAFDKAQEGS